MLFLSGNTVIQIMLFPQSKLSILCNNFSGACKVLEGKTFQKSSYSQAGSKFGYFAGLAIGQKVIIWVIILIWKQREHILKRNEVTY